MLYRFVDAAALLHALHLNLFELSIPLANILLILKLILEPNGLILVVAQN